jgi:bifunctional NMN adenylyltransferase/nudix hydrolase
MSKPSWGVIVGRFQVHELHDGHMELFRAVRGLHNRVIVFVGVSPTGITPRNPLDFEARARMIQAKFPEFTVLPLKDTMTDEMWSANLDEKIREVVNYGDVTLYGGRDSFVPHYHGSFPPVELLLPSYKTSGEDIRKGLTNTVKESADFRAGIIHAAMNMRPRVVTTVDVIIAYKDVEVELLLGKKKGEPGWRFIGGHAEATTESFEADARKEVFEETGLELGSLRYVGSCIIPDWRWEKEDSKIKSLVFVGEATTLGARANDDIDEVKWFRLDDMAPHLLVPTHRPLFQVFVRDLIAQWERKDATRV